MNVYKGRLLKISSNWKLKLVLSTLVTTRLPNIAFHLQPICLQTLVAINSEIRIRITSDIVFQLLHATIKSLCAVRFKSEQTPLPQTGHWFRSAALHRIQFRTCGFVPYHSFDMGHEKSFTWENSWKQWSTVRVEIQPSTPDWLTLSWHWADLC